MKNIALIALAAAGLAANAPAAVILDQLPSSATVLHGDLDLNTSDGVRALDRRITSAARRVCALSGPASTAEVRKRSECVRSATAQARTQIGVALAERRQSPGRSRS